MSEAGSAGTGAGGNTGAGAPAATEGQGSTAPASSDRARTAQRDAGEAVAERQAPQATAEAPQQATTEKGTQEKARRSAERTPEQAEQATERNHIEPGQDRQLGEPDAQDRQGGPKVDDEFVAELDARLAKAELAERGWREREDLAGVMRDMRHLAREDWQRADKLWEKHRGPDNDKPVFLDQDYVDPEREAQAKGPALEEEEAERKTLTARDREREEQRRRLERAAEQLRRRYLVADRKYYERDEETTLAFEDKGRRLATNRDDPATARSMVELAEGKGWQSIKIKGSEKFKAEAWVQAAARGIEVRGYKPRDVDLARLEELRAERERSEEGRQNSVERAPQRDQARDRTYEPRQRGGEGQEAQRPLSRQQETAVEALKAALRARGDSERSVNMAAEVASERFQNGRVYVGKVLEHGAAPYEHNKDNKRSYYVKLETKDGERTVWGVDLQRALDEGKTNVGDEVMLANRGRQQVTVKVKDRDEDGKVTGDREITTHRNSWEVKNVEAMREEVRQLIEEQSRRRPRGRQPVLKVYDNQAARSAERQVPERQEPSRDAERTR